MTFISLLRIFSVRAWIFLGLPGVQRIFSFNFPWKNTFCYFNPPITFLMTSPLFQTYWNILWLGPMPLAVSPKRTGKTTAAKVFLSLTADGNKNLVCQLSEVECMTQSSTSSFPYVYDDPDNLVSLKALVNNQPQEASSNPRLAVLSHWIRRRWWHYLRFSVSIL